MSLSKSLYHDSASHWNLQPEDSYGLGYEGDRSLYICHGRATGTFTIPASGIYRLSFALTSRDVGGRLKPMKLLLDGADLRDYTAFDCYTFMRYEVALPWLAAGDHTLTFTDTGDDTRSFPWRRLPRHPSPWRSPIPASRIPGRTSPIRTFPSSRRSRTARGGRWRTSKTRSRAASSCAGGLTA